MEHLSDQLLIETFLKAIEDDRELGFLESLVEEIKKREISIELLEKYNYL